MCILHEDLPVFLGEISWLPCLSWLLWLPFILWLPGESLSNHHVVVSSMITSLTNQTSFPCNGLWSQTDLNCWSHSHSQGSNFGELARIVMLGTFPYMFDFHPGSYFFGIYPKMHVECLEPVFSLYTWTETAQSVMTGYGFGNWCLILAGTWYYLLATTSRLSGSHFAIYAVYLPYLCRESFPRVKQLEYDADLLPPFSIECMELYPTTLHIYDVIIN